MTNADTKSPGIVGDGSYMLKFDISIFPYTDRPTDRLTGQTTDITTHRSSGLELRNMPLSSLYFDAVYHDEIYQ